MALYHSPSSILLIPPCLSLSVSFSGVPRSAAKNKTIIRLHLTSPLLSFVHVLLWMIRVLKASVQVITFFYIYIYIYKLFLSVWLFMWEYGFLLPLTSRTLHFFILF